MNLIAHDVDLPITNNFPKYFVLLTSQLVEAICVIRICVYVCAISWYCVTNYIHMELSFWFPLSPYHQFRKEGSMERTQNHKQ